MGGGNGQKSATKRERNAAKLAPPKGACSSSSSTSSIQNCISHGHHISSCMLQCQLTQQVALTVVFVKNMLLLKRHTRVVIACCSAPLDASVVGCSSFDLRLLTLLAWCGTCHFAGSQLKSNQAAMTLKVSCCYAAPCTTLICPGVK
jgi:hypothetical protein